MKLGIVADTHDNLDVIQEAVDLFSGEVDAVIHCGDIVAPFSVTPFDAEFDFYAVRGNNDGEWALKDTVRNFGAYLGEMGELSLGGARVAIYHGTNNKIVDALVDCGTYDLRPARAHTRTGTRDAWRHGTNQSGRYRDQPRSRRPPCRCHSRRGLR